MILGTQWYILFNVVAGASAIPSELRDIGTNLQVRGWLWWRKDRAAGDISLLPHRRDHRVRRFLERQHRRRSRLLGRHASARERARRLYCAGDGGRRHAPHRAWHRGDEFVRGHRQSPVLAAALLVCRTKIPAWMTLDEKARAMSDALLQIESCCQSFPKPDGEELLVLDDINFTLKEGEIVGLLGRSGSGKSTLAAADLGIGAAGRGQGGVSGPHGHRAGARHRHGVPDLRAVSLADRSGKRAAWPGSARPARGRDPPPRARRHRPDRPRRLRVRPIRANCPAACASASALPARWSCIPIFF